MKFTEQELCKLLGRRVIADVQGQEGFIAILDDWDEDFIIFGRKISDEPYRIQLFSVERFKIISLKLEVPDEKQEAVKPFARFEK